jgi:hypothetical protein
MRLEWLSEAKPLIWRMSARFFNAASRTGVGWVVLLGLLASVSSGVSSAFPPDAELPPGRGIAMEELARSALAECHLRQRKLSEVGLGYHYHYEGPNGTTIITLGIFATTNDAAQAAELSHQLMPQKPRLDSGIGDQTWVWDSPRASAIRFRFGRALLRVGGDMLLPDCRHLALQLLAPLAAKSSLARDLPAPEAPRLQASGIGATLAPGRWTELSITPTGAGATESFVSGVWLEHGSTKRTAQANVFLVRAPKTSPGIALRFFATFEDNYVAVETRRLQVVSGD